MEADLDRAYKIAAAALGEMAGALALRRYRRSQLELWAKALRASANIIDGLAPGPAPPPRVE